MEYPYINKYNATCSRVVLSFEISDYYNIDLIFKDSSVFSAFCFFQESL